jgi:hypothetical protein
MGKRRTLSNPGHRDFETASMRVLTGQVTQKAVIQLIINALGGPATWAKGFALSYDAAKPGSPVRMQLDKAILSALAALKDDELDAEIDDFDEMKDYVRQILEEDSNDSPQDSDAPDDDDPTAGFTGEEDND